MANLRINETPQQEIQGWTRLEALLIVSNIIKLNPKDNECKMFQKSIESITGIKSIDWEEVGVHLLLRSLAGELKS